MSYNYNDFLENTLDNDITSLKKQLEKQNKTIEDQKKEIEKLQKELQDKSNTIKNNNITISNNYKLIQKYENTINKANNELNNPNPNASSNSANRNDMKVKFISEDNKVDCSIECAKNNIFAEVEEKLYRKYPEYRETNNNFSSESRTVLRFKTIAENNIGLGLPVILKVPQNNNIES